MRVQVKGSEIEEKRSDEKEENDTREQFMPEDMTTIF